MLMHKKKTFKEFVASDENVATNLLSSRLKLLESLDVISKRKLSSNKKENIYLLTEKGIELAPLIMELVIWSDKHIRKLNRGMNQFQNKLDKTEQIEYAQNSYREFAQEFDTKETIPTK